MADRDQVIACRAAATGLALPVRLRVAAETPLAPDAEGLSGLRLDLVPEDPDLRLPSIVCRFRGQGPGSELVSVTTATGVLDETHLVLLKRFWIGSEEAEAVDPSFGDVEPALPALSFGVAYLAQQLLNALPDAAVYGLLAAAYSLVYGLSGRINLYFGEIAAVGGLSAVIGAAAAGGAPAGALLGVAVGFGLWAATLHGTVVERLAMWPLRRASGQHGLVASVGVALALREYLRLAAGSQPHWVAPVLADPIRLARAGDFVVTVTPMALLLAGGAGTASAALLAMFRFTGFGRQWRAAADDPLAAAMMGVDPRRLSLGTHAIAAALVGAAGAGVTMHYGGIGFDYTTGLGLKALIAAILGGIGSVPGAFLGGVGIAGAEALWSAYMPIADRDLAIDIRLVAVLALRPGRPVRYARARGAATTLTTGGPGARSGLRDCAPRTILQARRCPHATDHAHGLYDDIPRYCAGWTRRFAAGRPAGVRRRRVGAIILDLVVVSIVASGLWIASLVLTFGLSLVILPPLFPFVAFFYNGLTVSGRSMATPGMRLCGLELRLDATGARVPFINAALHAVLFYVSWMIPPILLVSLLTRDKRCCMICCPASSWCGASKPSTSPTASIRRSRQGRGVNASRRRDAFRHCGADRTSGEEPPTMIPSCTFSAPHPEIRA